MRDAFKVLMAGLVMVIIGVLVFPLMGISAQTSTPVATPDGTPGEDQFLVGPDAVLYHKNGGIEIWVPGDTSDVWNLAIFVSPDQLNCYAAITASGNETTEATASGDQSNNQVGDQSALLACNQMGSQSSNQSGDMNCLNVAGSGSTDQSGSTASTAVATTAATEMATADATASGTSTPSSRQAATATDVATQAATAAATAAATQAATSTGDQTGNNGTMTQFGNSSIIENGAWVVAQCGKITVFRLPDGSFQVNNGPQTDGKIDVVIFDAGFTYVSQYNLDPNGNTTVATDNGTTVSTPDMTTTPVATTDMTTTPLATVTP